MSPTRRDKKRSPEDSGGDVSREPLRIEWLDGERGFALRGETRRPFTVAVDGALVWVRLGGRTYRVEGEGATASHQGEDADLATGTTAPMPGVVRSVRAAAGDEVGTGALLLVLEAMKMEHEVRATAPARVTAVHVREGQRVEAGARLIELEAVETEG